MSTMLKDRLDQGYAWVVLIASILCNTLFATVFLSPSLFLVNFMDAFEISTYQAGWIVSIYGFVLATGGVIGGVLVDKFSCRSVGFFGALGGSIALLISSQAHKAWVLVCVYSCVSAFCVAMTRLPPIVIIQIYFEKRRPFATGVSLAGYSLGVFIGLPAVAYCTETYGWRGAIMIVSGICLNICALMLMFVPLQQDFPSKEKDLQDKEPTKKNVIDCSIWKDPLFLLAAVSYALFQFGADVMFKVSTPRVELDLGMDKMSACVIVSAISIAGFVSRIISSIVANCMCINIIAMYAFSMLAGGGMIVVSAFIPDYILNIIIGGGYGLMFGMTTSVQTTVLVNLLGVEKIAQSNSLVSGMVGFTYLISVPFAGWIYDISESFTISYFTAGIVQCIGGAIAAILLFTSKPEEEQNYLTDITNSMQDKHVISKDSLVGSFVNLDHGPNSYIQSKEHLDVKHLGLLMLNTGSTPTIHRKGQIYNKNLLAVKTKSGSSMSIRSKGSIGLMGSVQNLQGSTVKLSPVVLGSLQSLSSLK